MFEQLRVNWIEPARIRFCHVFAGQGGYPAIPQSAGLGDDDWWQARRSAGFLDRSVLAAATHGPNVSGPTRARHLLVRRVADRTDPP